MPPCRDALIMHIERACFIFRKTIPRADGSGVHTMNGKVGGKLDRLFLQDLAEIQVEQPQKGHDYQDDYQECTKIEMFDGRTCKVRFGNAVLGPLSRKLGTTVPRSSSTTGCWSSSTTG